MNVFKFFILILFSVFKDFYDTAIIINKKECLKKTDIVKNKRTHIYCIYKKKCLIFKIIIKK